MSRVRCGDQQARNVRMMAKATFKHVSRRQMHIALNWLRMRTNRVTASRPTSLSNHGLEQNARNILRLPRYPGVSLKNLCMPGFATSLSSYRKWPIASIMKNFDWISVRTENRLSAFEADVAPFHRSSVVSCPRGTTGEPFVESLDTVRSVVEIVKGRYPKKRNRSLD